MRGPPRVRAGLSSAAIAFTVVCLGSCTNASDQSPSAPADLSPTDPRPTSSVPDPTITEGQPGVPPTPGGADPEPTATPPGDDGASEGPTGTPTTGGTDDPVTAGPPRTNLARFLKRCERETRRLYTAELIFDATPSLTLADPERFTARLTRPRERSDQSGSNGPNPKVKLACTVQARLLTASSRLEVSPPEWLEQKYVPPRQVIWEWIVTAKAGGTTEAVLQLKPVIVVRDPGGSVTQSNLRTEQFPVTFIAAVTPGQRARSWFSSLTGVVITLGAVASALGALGAKKLLSRRNQDVVTSAGPVSRQAIDTPVASTAGSKTGKGKKQRKTKKARQARTRPTG